MPRVRKIASVSPAIVPILVVLASGAVPRAAGDSEEKLAALQRWIAAVDEHRPGLRDAAAARVGAWKNKDLDELTPYIETLISLLPAPGNADAWPRASALAQKDVDAVRSVARAEAARGDVNRIMKRGALLHADIMMSGAGKASERLDAGEARREAGKGGRIAVIGLDGQHEGFAVIPHHWSLARTLLDGVHPDPAADGFVRLWYRATSAYMLMLSQWGELDRHLRHARDRLTPDANIHMDSGCLYEAYACPRAQAMMAAARSRGVRLDVRPADDNLRLAEIHFRQATVLGPLMIEPRVRLAHVRILLGRPAEAVAELESASIAATDPVVRYYAVLFLGQAEDALGHADKARDAYQRAAALYPFSQAPHVAASMLALEAGDRQAAQTALWNFLRAPTPERVQYDPWWAYYEGSGRNMRALVSKLWAAVPAGSAP